VTKAALVLLAFHGLGDDDFRVRQLSERSLDGSYAAVVLNRLAPYLTDDLETSFRLRRLEGRYYAAWDARLARNDWREYPSLMLLSPWCRPDYWHGNAFNRRRGHFCGWQVGTGDPFFPLIRRYVEKADANDGVFKYADGGFSNEWCFNGATLELFKDLRSGGAPAWAAEALLGYLRGRSALLEWWYGVREENYSRRAS
jgi:hypothetical protein